MRSVEIYLYPYRIPFLRSFSTAHGTMMGREGAMLELMTDEGIRGVGEIAPLPEFGGSGLALARAQWPQLAALLTRKTVGEGLELLHVEGERGMWEPTLRCGLEMALLDAEGKIVGRSVGALLAGAGEMPRPKVQVNAVVGATKTDAAIAEAREAVNAGFGCIKLKVGMAGTREQEIERVAAVRDALGPNVHLRLDANEAWSFEQAVSILAACAGCDIQYVEQPLKARDLVGMRALRQAVAVPIAADEAVGGLASARRALDGEAADVLIVKPQLAGGLRVGQQIIREAAERGVGCVVTSTLEAGIGVTAALHLAAASPEITLECGLATLPLLADDLLMEDMTFQDGCLLVPAGPGLGVELDRQALAHYGA